LVQTAVQKAALLQEVLPAVPQADQIHASNSLIQDLLPGDFQAKSLLGEFLADLHQLQLNPVSMKLIRS